MAIVSLDERQKETWNSFAAQHPYFEMTQSWEWGQFKEELGWQAVRLAVEKKGQIIAGAQILIKPIPLELASIAYIPRGPLGDWKDEETMAQLLAQITQVARQHKAVFLRMEPAKLNNPVTHQFLKKQGFNPSDYTNQPRATIIIDLTQKPDDILGQMRNTTRYNIRYARRKGVKVRPGTQEDLPAFYELMQATGQRAGFSSRIYDYYTQEWQIFSEQNRAKLFLAYYEDTLLAARMAFRFGNQAADIHACSTIEHRRLRPNYLLVWEAMQWAKAQGCTTYDLWGIPDEVGQAVYEGRELPKNDRRDGLWGVYEFKRGFSQNVVYFIGAYDYIFSKPLYWLATNKLFNSDTFDSIATRLDLLR